MENEKSWMQSDALVPSVVLPSSPLQYATAAYKESGIKCAKLPPYSPDLSPIENVWSLLDARLSATRPGGWEREKEFRGRVRNAVSWVNANHSAAMTKMVSSMPRRMGAVVEAKGAMTPY